jgi:signal transduction histidine kinase
MLLLLSVVCTAVPAQTIYKDIASFQRELTMAKTDSARCVAYIHLANAYIEANELDSCRYFATVAKKLASDKALPVLAGWADFLLGAYYFYEGNFDRGIALEQHVIGEAERLSAPLLRANAQKMVAWMYTEMGRENEALDLFFEALPVFKAHRWTDLQMNVSIGYYGVATCYFYLGSYLKARAYYDSAISAEPPLDEREMALALSDRAAVIRDYFNNPTQAMPDNERALKLANTLTEHIDAQAYVQSEVALTYAKLGDRQKARYWAESAYHHYEQIPLLKRYVSVCSALAETFYLVGDYQQAYQVEHETRALEDSIYKWRKLQVVEEMRTRYQTDRMTAEISSLNTKSLAQESLLIRNKTAVALLISFVFVLAVLGFIFARKREYYHKRIRSLESAEKVRLEKERISKDLHDSLGSRLSTISFGLQRAARETQHEPLHVIQMLTDGVASELRDFIWANSKGSVTVEELEQRINTLFWQVRQTNQPIDLELHVQENIDSVVLSPELGVHLFRIVQESVQNTIKHAKATRLTIDITYRNEHVHMEVRDNGIGFEWPLPETNDHFGLSNMKRRAMHLNGRFELKTAPRAGTCIAVTVPNRSIQ